MFIIKITINMMKLLFYNPINSCVICVEKHGEK